MGKLIAGMKISLTDEALDRADIDRQ